MRGENLAENRRSVMRPKQAAPPRCVGGIRSASKVISVSKRKKLTPLGSSRMGCWVVEAASGMVFTLARGATDDRRCR